MKKILAIFLISVSFIACKNDVKNTEGIEENTDIAVENAVKAQSFEGEFIYIADGAVLKGDKFIYAVALDDMSRELAKKVAPVKQDDFDMVPVTVEGILGDNPMFKETGEGWQQMLTITKIVEVGTAPAAADVKLGKSNN